MASKERKKGPFAVPPDQQPHQTLDGIHKRLKKEPTRSVSVKQRMLQLGASGPDQAALVLLGIMSGSEARRNMARCTWLRVGGNSSGVRTLFVVGKPGKVPLVWYGRLSPSPKVPVPPDPEDTRDTLSLHMPKQAP